MNSFKGKKALIVDTNFSALPIYEYLTSLEIIVYVIGRNPNDFVAKNFPNYIESDYSDPIVLMEIIKSYGFDYIIPGCNDHSYEVCANLSDASLLLNIDSIDATNTLLNKSKFREFAISNNLPVPRVFSLDTVIDADCPLIVKPVDSFSGKGVSKVDVIGLSAIQSAVTEASCYARNGDVIIEEFVEGQLYSHSAFLKGKKIIQDFVVEEYGSVNPFVVDTSFVKTDFSFQLLGKIRNSIEKLANLLNLCDGLIHTQFICSRENLWLIEITRRCPGDLYSRLIEISTGFKYAENYTKAFLGQELTTEILTEPAKKIIRHTITQQDNGIFYQLKFFHALNIVSYISVAIVGELLKPSPNGRVGVLFVLVESNNDISSLKKEFLERKVYQVNLL